jgi:DNA-binding CsgD family transcriptional regulator/tetratricopeptide (TPR) repeat protein
MAEGNAEFVGREREIEAVLAAADETSSGRSATLLVSASSGLGATRLLDRAIELLGSASSGPSPTVLRADNLPAWRGAPYGPFRVALEGLLLELPAASVERALGSATEVLLPVLPRVAERLGLEAAPPRSRELLGERIQEAVRGLIGRLAVEGPVVLVMEDLHVLDAASRSLLAFLVRTLGERPVLIVGTYQPDALGRAHPLRSTLRAIESGPRPVSNLALGALDRASLRALVTAREGEAPSAPVLLLVAERSAGSPLIAEEVLLARRALTGASLAVPLEQLVVARAARRSPECRRVLRILAIADGPVGTTELAAVAAAYDAEVGRPPPRSPGRERRDGAGLPTDLASGIDEAMEHGFVQAVGRSADADWSDESWRSTGGPAAAGSYRVRHELIAAALAADLLPGSRRRMHAALAAVIGNRPASAGRHGRQAIEPLLELRAELAAAAAAEAVGAAADAVGHLERSIALMAAPVVEGSPDLADEVDLLVRAADASVAAGDAGRAEAFAALALARHPNQRDRAARAGLIERLGSIRLARHDHEAAVTAFEEALRLLAPVPSLGRARLLATLAQVRMLDGRFSVAEELATEAIAVAEAVGPAARAWLGHATCTLGVVDGWLGRAPAAIRRLEEALDIAMAEERLDDAFRARANLATILDLEGRREEAIEVSRRGIEAAEAAGLEVVHGNLLRGSSVDALVTLGRWREAREMAERALEWAPSGIPFVNAALGLAIVEAETSAGDAAARLLGRLFLELETIPDVQFAAPAFQAAASLALWRGDLGDARGAIEAAWSRVRDSEDWVIGARTASAALAVADALVRAARDRRNLAGLASARAWADEVLRTATGMVEAAGVPGEARVRREAEADLATARAYSSRLRGRDNPEPWALAASGWRALGRPYDLARALRCQVEAELERSDRSGRRGGGRDRARGPLLESASIATSLGAIPLLRALADLADRALITLDPASLTALANAGRSAPASEAVGSTDRLAIARRRTSLVPDRRTAESFGLSPREQGVLSEIVAGRTNREIGRRLFISEKTVGIHVGKILAKLGVSGRVEAATVALRLGLVEDRFGGTKKPGSSDPGFVGRRHGGAA